jgi:hypothetical protein
MPAVTRLRDSWGLSPRARSAAPVYDHGDAAPSRNKLATTADQTRRDGVQQMEGRWPRKVSEQTPMNAKFLATIMVAFLPALALAQSDQKKSKADQPGNESGQTSAAGKNGNGSDANGAATPGGAGSDSNATTAPSSKPPSKAQ